MQLFDQEKDIYQQTSLSNIQDMSKLRTYVTLKDNITVEEYLSSVKKCFKQDRSYQIQTVKPHLDDRKRQT